jgi:hypothetical protein
VAATSAQTSPPALHVASWRVDFYLYEGDESTARPKDGSTIMAPLATGWRRQLA